MDWTAYVNMSRKQRWQRLYTFAVYVARAMRTVVGGGGGGGGGS